MSSWAVSGPFPKMSSGAMLGRFAQRSGSGRPSCEVVIASIKDAANDAEQKRDGGLSFEEKAKIGGYTKRLIDMGRVYFLRSQGFHAKLLYYIPPISDYGSLENTLLLVHEQGTSMN